MNEEATYAVCTWIDNDPGRRGAAVRAACRGLDRLRDYLLGEVREAKEPDRDGPVWNPHDGGPAGIARDFDERTLYGEVDWAEVSEVLGVTDEDRDEDE